MSLIHSKEVVPGFAHPVISLPVGVVPKSARDGAPARIVTGASSTVLRWLKAGLARIGAVLGRVVLWFANQEQDARDIEERMRRYASERDAKYWYTVHRMF